MRGLGLMGALLLGVVGLIGVRMIRELEEPSGACPGYGPVTVSFLDRPIGHMTQEVSSSLSGDVLLRHVEGQGVVAQGLESEAPRQTRLFDATGLRDLAPDRRHLVALSDDRWLVVQLSTLHVVAETRGGMPVFIDNDRLIAVAGGRGCTRRDAVVVDLRRRTQRRVALSGPPAGLEPQGTLGRHVVLQRMTPGDSYCREAGVAVLDVDTGVIATLDEVGSITAIAREYLWVNGLAGRGGTTVVDVHGQVVSSGPPVATAGMVGQTVVYAESNPVRHEIEEPRPTRLRAGLPTGIGPADPAGDELLDPRVGAASSSGTEVLVSHREPARDGKGYATILSICSLPDLDCRRLDDVTSDIPRAIIVPANALK